MLIKNIYSFYIDFRVRNHIEVEATSLEEAKKQLKEQFQDQQDAYYGLKEALDNGECIMTSIEFDEYLGEVEYD